MHLIIHLKISWTKELWIEFNVVVQRNGNSLELHISTRVLQLLYIGLSSTVASPLYKYLIAGILQHIDTVWRLTPTLELELQESCNPCKGKISQMISGLILILHEFNTNNHVLPTYLYTTSIFYLSYRNHNLVICAEFPSRTWSKLLNQIKICFTLNLFQNKMSTVSSHLYQMRHYYMDHPIPK